MGKRAILAAVAALCFCAPASAHNDGGRQLAFAWPASGTVTSPFGNDNGRWHPGLDIGILRSLSVTAAAPGVVIDEGYPGGFEGYGNVVVVQVAPQMVTLYAHLASTDVHRGEYVTAGERLGTAGCTGYCTGTHLHFELRERGASVDPRVFLG
jgi:murein DD-endopeptidase MepM/ murein hydrolase activator NlpD